MRRSPQDELNDADIKKLAETDGRQALLLLFRKYRGQLVGHAYGIVKDLAEAEDLTQDAFIKASKEPEFFSGSFKMAPWLFRVVTNGCLNSIRDRCRRLDILEQRFQQEQRTNTDPLDAIFADERRVHVLHALKHVKAHHRTILLFRYNDDLSYPEITRVLGVPIGTVMSRLSRAKTALAEVMETMELRRHFGEF